MWLRAKEGESTRLKIGNVLVEDIEGRPAGSILGWT
jgi:hypothetical protein